MDRLNILFRKNLLPCHFGQSTGQSALRDVNQWLWCAMSIRWLLYRLFQELSLSALSAKDIHVQKRVHTSCDILVQSVSLTSN